MPAIRVTVNPGTPQQQDEYWEITEERISDDGYLESFRLEFADGQFQDFHLIRHDISPMDAALSLTRGAVTVNASRSLLNAINESLGKPEWKKHANALGLAVGSIHLLAEFFKTNPFAQEGYYDVKGKIWLKRKINTRNVREYSHKNGDIIAPR